MQNKLWQHADSQVLTAWKFLLWKIQNKTKQIIIYTFTSIFYLVENLNLFKTVQAEYFVFSAWIIYQPFTEDYFKWSI